MTHKLLLIAVLSAMTLLGLLGFILDSFITAVLLLICAIVGWAVFPISKPVKVPKADRPHPKKERQVRDHGIPKYEKSLEEMEGCFNCYYSKDISNDTYVHCSKWDKNVFRNYTCQNYKV